MNERSMVSRLAGAARRAARLLAQPARAVRGRGGLVLQPYRGYGSRREVFLIGRVFRQSPSNAGPREETLAQAMADLGRRLLRHGIGRAVLVARFAGAEQRLTTDHDGYFRVSLRPKDLPPGDGLWHRMTLELLEPQPLVAEAELFIPPAACRFVVISDIDDTVMHTGVANRAGMLFRLFLQGAESRVAFPGVAALLRALHHGATRAEHNPMLYVSRAPWSIYEVLDAFFRLHAIPVGPLLFLREWGLTLQSPLPRRGKGHKLELIRNMLALYDDLPFILIGDSGQRDPEIYAQVVREHPGRVLAIYIRNVTRDPERHQAVTTLAIEVGEAGSTLLLAADSLAMAEHAAAHGLIAREALAEVGAERAAEPEAPAPQPTRAVTPPSPEATRETLAQGQLEEALDQGADPAAPPNVVVEPGLGERRR
jgi:phosphatidate phosphatase APP1